MAYLAFGVTMKPLKIAIVGTASTSVHKAPYDNTGWDIWSLGANAEFIPRYDRWFEMHTQRVLKNTGSWNASFEFWGKCGDKLMLGHPCPELPYAKPYPIEEIKAKFGNYFTSTIAYMIALAIYEDAKEIGIWGIDMMGDEEYARQRPCCEYYLGMARALGINVVIAEESPLLRAERMYAYEYCELSAEIALMTQNIARAEAEASKKVLEAKHDLSYRQGQRDILTTIHRKFG
jgi:uncharacterized small protein (DUF1192 family)